MPSFRRASPFSLLFPLKVVLVLLKRHRLIYFFSIGVRESVIVLIVCTFPWSPGPFGPPIQASSLRTFPPLVEGASSGAQVLSFPLFS